MTTVVLSIFILKQGLLNYIPVADNNINMASIVQ